MEDNFFRVKAYQNAAHGVETLTKDIETIKEDGKLEEIPGVGKGIAKKIEEILDTGTSQDYEKLKKKYPVRLGELSSVEGIGPKTIKLLYKELGIENLDDLEYHAREKNIRKIKGMGEKKEKAILENIEFARKFTSRSILGEVLPLAEEIKSRLSDLSQTDRVEIAGSIRRWKETVGDIDILVISKQPVEVMDYFVSMDIVGEIIVKGPAKSTVRLKKGIECDIRVFDEEVFGAALMYFTGSRELNVQMRKLSISQGLKLNEYGLFKKEKKVAGKNEKEVFQALKLDYIPPELRENRGELEAAQKNEIPSLVKLEDIKGDLHLHSTWSDGTTSIDNMVDQALKLDYEYLAFTEHTGSLKIANGMNEDRILKQVKAIDQINDDIAGFTILKGLEVNIDVEGKLDIRDEILEDMDLVLAAIHSGLSKGTIEMTQRLIEAMENEHVDIIAHPTGRKLQTRKEYDLNLDQIFETAQETGTLLEVNSNPIRLDLRDINIRRAIEHGCKLVLNTDAHSAIELNNIRYGVGTARRGWAQNKDIANTLPLKDFLKVLKN